MDREQPLAEIKVFTRALFRIWWAYMGSGLFAILALYAAVTGKTNPWVAAAITVLAMLGLMIAAFRVWRIEYMSNRDGPDMSVSVEVPFPYGKTLEGDEEDQFLLFRNVGKEAALNVEVIHPDNDVLQLSVEPHTIAEIGSKESYKAVLYASFEGSTSAKSALHKFLSADERRGVEISVRFHRLGGPMYERGFIFRKHGYLIRADTTGLKVTP
jgi:hypothetical protein